MGKLNGPTRHRSGQTLSYWPPVDREGLPSRHFKPLLASGTLLGLAGLGQLWAQERSGFMDGGARGASQGGGQSCSPCCYPLSPVWDSLGPRTLSPSLSRLPLLVQCPACSRCSINVPGIGGKGADAKEAAQSGGDTEGFPGTLNPQFLQLSSGLPRAGGVPR